MQNPRRSWWARWYSARTLCGFGVVFALGGAAWISYAVVAGAGSADYLIGATWLALAANWFVLARQLRRREQLGFDLQLPGAEQDVQALVAQGRKIEAIKRYRRLNPGIGLREAKNVVDEL